MLMERTRASLHGADIWLDGTGRHCLSAFPAFSLVQPRICSLSPSLSLSASVLRFVFKSRLCLYRGSKAINAREFDDCDCNIMSIGYLTALQES